MSDGLIHIPARKKNTVTDQQVVRLSPEAYNRVVEIYNESILSMKEIVSLLIIHAADRVVYDKESD